MKTKKAGIYSIAVFIIISLFLLTPIFATFLYSVFADFTGIIPKEFTLDFYALLFSADMRAAIARTLIISIVPTMIIFVLVLFAVYAVKSYFPELDKFFSVASKIPYGIQGIIMAVSVLSLYSSGFGLMSNRIFLLTATYCIMVLPYMYQGVKNSLDTIDMAPILESAQVLGANRLYAFVTIIVPAITRGLFTTILLCTGLLLCDFVLVNILAGSYYSTLGIIMNKISAKSGHAASVISVAIFVMMLVLSLITDKLNKEAD